MCKGKREHLKTFFVGFGFFVLLGFFSPGVCIWVNHLIYEGVVTPPTDKIGAGFSPTIAIKHVFQQHSLIHHMKQQLISQIGEWSTNQIQTCATGSRTCTITCTKGWLYERHGQTCGRESIHAVTETQHMRKHIRGWHGTGEAQLTWWHFWSSFFSPRIATTSPPAVTALWNKPLSKVFLSDAKDALS